MQNHYLEITFRHGRPLAAYLYLPRVTGETTQHTAMSKPGLIIDFGFNNKPIGIEITAPEQVTIEELNALLIKLGLSPAQDNEFRPLLAA